ncbi:hypothetical protein FKM82_025886 [Ascaphus truei]
MWLGQEGVGKSGRLGTSWLPNVCRGKKWRRAGDTWPPQRELTLPRRHPPQTHHHNPPAVLEATPRGEPAHPAPDYGRSPHPNRQPTVAGPLGEKAAPPRGRQAGDTRSRPSTPTICCDGGGTARATRAPHPSSGRGSSGRTNGSQAS